MKLLWEKVVPANSGYGYEMKQGQYTKITATTTVDFVCLNRSNLRERFDQARTKANQRTIFVTAGHKLYSKFNNVMMTIVEDTFKEGTHDMQHGMCSRTRFELVRNRGDWADTYKRAISVEEIPDHGCWENLISGLDGYDIAPEDIPSPFNMFQHMEVDPKTGRLEHTLLRPKPGTYVLLRAEMDLVCAFSACPDVIVGGKDVTVGLLEE